MDFSPVSVAWITFSAFAAVLLASIIMGLFSSNKMPVEGKTVLITGASEGMGLAAATQLSAKGANVILVSRSVEKLQSALEAVQAAAKNPDTQRFHYISADVALPSYAGPVVLEATAWNNGRSPDIVWCVAGTATPELFVDMDMASMRRQMDINYFGTAEMSQAILKEWLAPDTPVEDQPKHLIMTTSVVVFFPIPGYLPYLPSKFAIRGFAEGLCREVMLYPQNVNVHLVCPGSILSPGFERENLSKPQVTKKLEEGDPKQTPDEVAQQSIHGLESGNFLITVNWLNWLMQCGSLGSSIRSSIVDSLVACFMTLIVWPIVHLDIHGQIKKYRIKHGHPSTYTKQP